MPLAQPALGIECGRAAAGCGGDCLAIAAVDQVTGGEYALRGGTGRIAIGHDVATGIEVDEPDQGARARFLADSDEDGGDRDGGIAGVAGVAYAQPGDMLGAVYGQHFGGGQDRDVGMCPQAINGDG
ncbi:hypothetical protein A5623_06265 [Mycobacterium colombiense]|uniref:Uncharacterized protein n=1 Tax=Mycobacterium colombiense TaxID=339268 RepID=A0A853M488_9MYCO|nr:hypothetical protein A5623_06265 [Mycobacterium colombiense]OBJ60809.1 hypothetical protein A5628_07120 [Mycobacterium colombiense]